MNSLQQVPHQSDINLLSSSQPHLPGALVLDVLRELADWGDLVTIVLHGGCVFEYKGRFPSGSVARGFYNLHSLGHGFEGHLRLDAIDHIGFQDREHAGRMAHALTFNDVRGDTIFKVFLGRDDSGVIHSHQLISYEQLKQRALSFGSDED